MRNSPVTITAAGRWPDLVHPDIVDREDRARHGHFIVTRLVAGILGLVCFPPYLAWRGAPGGADVVLAALLAGPILAAFVASWTGRMVPAVAVSAVASGGLVVCLAAAGERAPWLVMVWLLVEPLDALLAGPRRPALAAALVSVLALMLVGAMNVGEFDGPARIPAGLAAFFLAGTALVRAVGHGLRLQRSDALRRDEAAERDIEERSLLEVVGDLVLWHGQGGDVLRAGGGATRVLGVTTGSLLGRGLLRHVHVSDRPAFLRALDDAAHGDEPTRVEFRLHAGEDESPVRVTWVEMRCHRVAGTRSGTVVVSIVRDMTVQRRHEGELEKARQEAERANELKGRFLATVTHELRTPLNAIIGFSELLAAEHPFVVTEERRKEYAGIIRDSGNHLLEVVNTLLDMSKIETGNFNFEPDPFSLPTLVESCCDLMQLRADQAGVTLVRRLGGDIPEILADRRACRQVLINLLSNAVKFTPAGGRVTVSLARDRDRLVLRVSDTGIGIGEGDLPRLGDPFFQAGDAYRRPHEGTGLGLSVVRGLVGLHGGTLAIESGAGIGTDVIVALPLAGPAPEPERRPVLVRTAVLADPAGPLRMSA